ncbi:STAS-like domain-containing protein [Alicycliphilus denitrificans]|uniref:STAS-like domain-containing protein n=1 Tax=Alicycliphilus denitrificans TaxID=179636 RepID=UPI0001DA01FA|nr:DUF4325 domain-containing protein [Alicycliphilus denitrificans]ADU99442.1 hypothetical protein Alide_1687 [Alicycliphilus denitrificans BC]
MTTLSVASQFSRYPGGRFKRISENSGEQFREDVLLPALQKDGLVVVDLDGVVGYGSSFLEEVFGGVVRAKRWKSREEVNKHLRIASEKESWLREANMYIDAALALLK